MRKVIALLMCVILVFGVTACNSKDDATTDSGSKETKSSETANTESSETPSGETKELIIWAWDQNLPSINYAAEQYKEMNPDSNVEVVVQNVPDTVDKMSTFFASGIGTDLPDMVLMDNLQIQTFLQQFPDKFVNLSEMGYDTNKDDFSVAHWELLSHEGSLYAFPFDIAPIMMAVNNDIMAAAGVDATSLKTWDDFMAAAPAVNDAGYSMHIKFGRDDVLAMLQTAGVGILDADGNIDLLNPKVVETVETYLKLQASNASDAVSEDGAAFGEGKVATMLKPAWMIGEDMPAQMSLEGKLSLIPMPMVQTGSGYTSSANSGGSSFFILASSEVKEAAYEIGAFITTDLDSQNIALAQGLMPGYLPAAKLEEFTSGVDYYNGQAIWKELSDSASETLPIYVNEYYSSARDIFQNVLVDAVRNGTDSSAMDLLQETADLIASQTGLSVNDY